MHRTKASPWEKLSPQVTDEVCGITYIFYLSRAKQYRGNTSSVSPVASHLLLKEKAYLFSFSNFSMNCTSFSTPSMGMAL